VACDQLWPGVVWSMVTSPLSEPIDVPQEAQVEDPGELL
jgi:hypothetical protein